MKTFANKARLLRKMKKHSRGPYNKIDLTKKEDIIKDLYELDEITVAKKYNTTVRRIRAIKRKESRLRSSGRVSQNLKENMFLFEKALKFFSEYKTRPNIKGLASFYLRKNDFFRSNGQKSNFTKNLIHFLLKKSGKANEELIKKPPLNERNTLEKLENLNKNDGLPYFPTREVEEKEKTDLSSKFSTTDFTEPKTVSKEEAQSLEESKEEETTKENFVLINSCEKIPENLSGLYQIGYIQGMDPIQGQIFNNIIANLKIEPGTQPPLVEVKCEYLEPIRKESLDEFSYRQSGLPNTRFIEDLAFFKSTLVLEVTHDSIPPSLIYIPTIKYSKLEPADI